MRKLRDDDCSINSQLLDWANALGDRARIARWYNNDALLAKVQAEIIQFETTLLEKYPRLSDQSRAFFVAQTR